MHLVNGGQFLNITFKVLLTGAAAAVVFRAVIIALKWPYHWKFNFNVTIGIICSSWSSFFSNQFFDLNLNDWFLVTSNKFIIFWYSIIILSHYHINLWLSMIFCLSSGDIYFSLSISYSVVTQLFCSWDSCNFISNFISN